MRAFYKYWIYLWTLSAIVSSAVSCSKDIGNYDYRELDGPVITGVAGNIEILTQERLSITPVITGGLSEDSYDYEWKVIGRNGENEVTVIGEERDLDYTVILSPDEYSLFYTLREKKTGIYWQVESVLKVSSSMSKGWMVLCSENGRTRLDFISEVTGMTYTDVLKDNSGMPAYDGPRRIHWQSAMSFADSPYYLFTDRGATRLGKDSFGWKEEYRMVYEMASMADIAPSMMVSAGFGKLIASGTDVYYSENMGIRGLYGSPVNRGFRAAPYIGANVSGEQYAAVYLLYDVDSKRFMAYCPLLEKNDLGGQETIAGMDEMGLIAEGLAEKGQESVVGNAFDRYPEGYDLVYMENTLYDPGNAYMGVTYSVLSDGNSRYVYGIQLGDMLRFSQCPYVLGKAYYGDISGCENITSEGILYAFSSLRNYMYYAVGDTVYGVDLNASPLRSEVQFRLAGETVTCLKFNLFKKSKDRRSYNLTVGSVNGDEGILRVYEGYDSNGDFRNVRPEVYKGFAEIVDAAYKERTY